MTFDTEAQREQFVKMYARLAQEIPGCDFVASPSKSGGGKLHATVTLPVTVTLLERIALQSILGSDPMREFLSLRRVANGDNQPTLLIETTPEYNRTEKPGFTLSPS